MKKFLAALGAAVLIAGTAFADPLISLSSLGSSLSGGLFGNELDSAFSVSDSQFGKLGKNYLFTGITNVNNSALTSSGDSVYAGFYKAGANPWSVVGLVSHTGAASATNSQTDTTGSVAVVSGTTTTNYSYLTQSDKTTQNGVAYGSINDRVGFYTKMAGFNIGAEIQVGLSNVGYSPAANQEQTVTDYYNSAGAGVAPVSTASGSKKTVTTAPGGGTNSVTIGVPFYMETGSMQHYAYAKLGLSGADSSNSSEVSYSIADAAQYNTLYGATLTDTDTKNVNKTSVITFAPTYKIQVPGFAGHADNRHFAQLDLSFKFAGAEQSANTATQILGYTGSAYASAGNSYTSTATDYTKAMTTDITADVTGGTLLYFDLGEGAVFGIMPSVKIGYSINTPAAYNTETKQTVKTDANSNGVYTDAGDSIVVTTTKYTTSDGAVGTTSNDFAITMDAPVALKVKPASWFFGVYIASAPTFKMNVNTSTTVSAASESTAVTTNAGGTSTTVTKTNATPTSVSTQATWTTSATHSFGLFFDLGKNIKMETILNSSNLLAFDSLKVQAIFALP